MLAPLGLPVPDPLGQDEFRIDREVGDGAL